MFFCKRFAVERTVFCCPEMSVSVLQRRVQCFTVGRSVTNVSVFQWRVQCFTLTRLKRHCGYIYVCFAVVVLNAELGGREKKGGCICFMCTLAIACS